MFSQMFYTLKDFLVNVYNAFNNLWSFEFSIGTLKITFPAMLTSALVVLMAIFLIRKFIL